MKCEVVGIQRKTGSFDSARDGNHYDFDIFLLHCVGKRMGVFGHAVREVKLKVEDAAELLASVGGKPENVIGHIIDFEFGNYGKVIGFELVK